MAETRLTFKPGIDVEGTATASRGGWNNSNLVRFRSGFVEKLLGWLRICDTPLTGVCRALHYWVDLLSRQWIAAGTNSHLFLEQGAALFDITPAGFVPGPVSSGAVPYSLLVWSLDNFGQDLLAIPSHGGVYIWTPPTTAAPAAIIPQAPPFNQGGFLAMPQQIIICYGSSPDMGTQDPMLVRWCDQSDFNSWTPSVTNQAGSYRLSRGNRIVGGTQTLLAALLWTDIDCWSIQYIQFPLVFGFFQVTSNCGLISQKAFSLLGSVVYWMSDHGFFAFSGGQVVPIPCSVWDKVFFDLDRANQDKIVAGADYLYDEVWFHYPSLSGGTGENDSYVKYNTRENVWDYGQLPRSAWTDQNQSGSPLAVDGQTNRLIRHDVGFNADNLPMVGVLARSGYSDMAEGQEFLFVDRIIPDFLWQGTNPQIQVTLFFRNWPGETPSVEGPYTITPSTEFVTFRTRAREVALELSMDSIDSWFRLGVPRLRIAPSGRV